MVKQLPPHMFILEGIFLGYLSKKKKKVKAIVLEVEQEQLVIKLPKEVRGTIQDYQFQPGDQIRCIGRSQVNFTTGVIKLRAYQVFPLLPPKDDRPAAAPPIIPIPTAATAHPTAAKQHAKVLICHKSGCQKRGGRQLISTLETILQEYQLQDQVEIQYTGCQKRCSKAPTLTIMPGKHRYDRLNLQSLPTLVEQHFCHSEQISISDEL
ncbi:dna-binding protein [Leptolyngbya sp. Heron Island J]|uniref:(2Fe-2S) ferredoxin domain-containing protein n=1 Tax=Leptolyngbya sp. Heron Island J TaxID=1385935 RepID=UPI0003B980FA|nr:(2Fe-2S) ferredoxin domain-containing protein [Leptolyngbya sp. Heron Island J]ESA34614.1 dna-binding protein [Leptolyngbya sp. Heron Island J]